MIVYHFVLGHPAFDEMVREVGAAHERALFALAGKTVFGQMRKTMVTD